MKMDLRMVRAEAEESTIREQWLTNLLDPTVRMQHRVAEAARASGEVLAPRIPGSALNLPLQMVRSTRAAGDVE